jgi:hypothetical protein
MRNLLTEVYDAGVKFKMKTNTSPTKVVLGKTEYKALEDLTYSMRDFTAIEAVKSGKAEVLGLEIEKSDEESYLEVR